MLPTLAVILWAYGMYALIRAYSRRKNGYHQGRGRGRRLAWLGLAAGASAGLGVALWLSLADGPPDPRLKLAGFLGTVWAEGRADKVQSKVEVPQIKGQGDGGQPAYALLHPETPASQWEGEKAPPASRRLAKPRVRKGAGSQVKAAAKAAPAPSKKDKVAAKAKAKKKKPPATATAAAPKATGG